MFVGGKALRATRPPTAAAAARLRGCATRCVGPELVDGLHAPAASARADPTQLEIVGGEEPIIDTIEVSGDQYEVAKHYVDTRSKGR